MHKEKISPKDTLEHSWRYFALHAQQRMSMFNYFVLCFGIASAGLSGCVQATGIVRRAGVGLGLALAVIAFIFWKLDARSSFLIKHAEEALKSVELDSVVASAHLFSTEPHFTDGLRGFLSAPIRMWTFSESFRVVFLLAGLVGIGGALLCACFEASG